MNILTLTFFFIFLKFEVILIKMNAIVVKQFGGPEVCEYMTNVPIPEPNENQVNFIIFFLLIIFEFLFI